MCVLQNVHGTIQGFAAEFAIDISNIIIANLRQKVNQKANKLPKKG